jgi:flagellar biogenesis protein FliO
MANFEETGPSKPTTEATRVDKITPSYRVFHYLRAIIVVVIAVILLIRRLQQFYSRPRWKDLYTFLPIGRLLIRLF